MFCPSSDVTVDGYRRFWSGCNDVRATDVEGANGYPLGYDVRGVHRVARGEDESVEQKTISFFLGI